MKQLGGLIMMLLVASVTLAVPTAVGAADHEAPTLWLVDAGTKTTYRTTFDGRLITSFPTPNTATSSVTVDPVDRLLWGVNEGSGSNPTANPGKLVKYDRTGTVVREIPASTFGGMGGEGLAVTVGGDRSLWVVDDPSVNAPPGRVPTVYNVNPISGARISSFPTSAFDPAAVSPQDIAYDPFSDSLWIADNASETVYNVTTTGLLLGRFDTRTGPFSSDPVRNIQGISVETAEVLWLTARDTDRIYRVTKAGDRIIQSFPMSQVDPNAANPTGVAYDNPAPVLDFRVVETFAVFGLPDSKIKIEDGDQSSGVVGRVGLGPDAEQDFNDGLLTGDYLVDPDADDSADHDVVISGVTTTTGLSGVVASANAVAGAAAGFMPQQSYGDLKSDTTIALTPGVNVVQAKKIELDGHTLVLAGTPATTVIFNVTDKLKVKNAGAITVAGGLRAENVLFNVVGDGDSAIESGGYITGGILAPYAKFTVKDPGSILLGSVFGGDEIAVKDGGRVRQLSEALAPGDFGLAGGPAALALPGAKATLKDGGSTINGDVALGPLSAQDFDTGLIDGKLVVDPAADNTNDHSVEITGGVVSQGLSRAVADAIDGSTLSARLTPDQGIQEIKNSTTISAGSGLTVVATKKIELDDDDVLTISGSAGSTVIFNIEEKIVLKDDSRIVLSGGITPAGVVFNVRGDNESKVEAAASGAGTILAPFGKAKVAGEDAAFVGSVISGVEVVVEKGGLLVGG